MCLKTFKGKIVTYSLICVLVFFCVCGEKRIEKRKLKNRKLPTR